MRIKVTKQVQLSQPVFIVYVSDVSKKFVTKIMKRQADEQYAE